MARVTAGIPTGGYAGKFGNAVFYEREGQLHMRERVVGTNPRTPEQQAGRRAQGAVARGWSAIPDDADDAWVRFGEAEGTTGYLAYMSLTRRWLRLHPGEAPPEWPPAGPFFGDAVVLTVSVSEPPPPAPSSKTSHLEEGVLRVTASQPNAAGVVTEILTQPLANRRRKPRARDWKGVAYLTFEGPTLTQTVPLPQGAHAVAYRFLNAATGQATAMAVLGAATVE